MYMSLWTRKVAFIGLFGGTTAKDIAEFAKRTNKQFVCATTSSDFKKHIKDLEGAGFKKVAEGVRPCWHGDGSEYLFLLEQKTSRDKEVVKKAKETVDGMLNYGDNYTFCCGIGFEKAVDSTRPCMQIWEKKQEGGFQVGKTGLWVLEGEDLQAAALTYKG